MIIEGDFNVVMNFEMDKLKRAELIQTKPHQ